MKVQRTLRWRDTKVQRIVKEGVSHGVEGTGSSGEGKLREGERSGGGRGGALPLGRHQDDSQLCQRPPESVDDAPSSLLLLDGAWRSGRPRPSSLPPPLFPPRLGPRMGRDGGAFELIRLPLPDLRCMRGGGAYRKVVGKCDVKVEEGKQDSSSMPCKCEQVWTSAPYRQH